MICQSVEAQRIRVVGSEIIILLAKGMSQIGRDTGLSRVSLQGSFRCGDIRI